ncbi:MAG: FKBP-type peptidyl-prolyl cis-trans isomerase, partial [Clostridia bacterium]|nr:FKBP-type peptidyl-prolyl cis-trans isomerase [Clostridia bacterium]
MKRYLTFGLALLCMFSAFAGCKKDPDKELNTLENTPIQVQTNNTEYDVPVIEELKYDVDFAEYIKIPDITTIELDYHTMSTDDKSVDDQIYGVQLQKAVRTEITDRPAAEGDVVTVNYKSVFYGTDQQISDQKAVEISLGKRIAIPALEDAIVGMSKGETKTADIVYPEDYAGNTILANSKATFTIELVKIESAKLPELTDEFIKELNFENVTNYTELREYVVSWIENENYLYKQDALYNTLIEKSELIAMPQGEYNYYLEKFDANSQAAADATGVELDAYIITNYTSREAYDTKREEYAQTNVKKDLVIYCLKERYNVEVTKEEFNLALNVTFKSEAESIGITEIGDFYDKMGT